MLLAIGVIGLELIALYALSRRLIHVLFHLMASLTCSRTAAIWTLTILFFPGTVVHELAHLFVAEILRVRTGKLTLVPEGLSGNEVKTGSVAIAQTDPFRRTIIGLAPVYVGIAALAVLSYFLSQDITVINVITIIIYYGMFSISNSMFSSREDMKGVIPFTITFALFAAAAYIAGFRIGLTGELLVRITNLLEMLVRSLGVVLAVNAAVLVMTLSATHVRIK